MGNLGATEIILILLVVVLLFGGQENTGTYERYWSGDERI